MVTLTSEVQSEHSRINKCILDFEVASPSVSSDEQADVKQSDLAARVRWGLHPSLAKVDSLSSMSTSAPSDADSEDTIGGLIGFRHRRVPKALNFSAAGSAQGGTTLMIRNIPNRYSQDELIDELEGLGLAGSFDFFYAPVDVGTLFNVGYAFVNFVDAASATRCQELLEGFTFLKHLKSTSKRRVATVSVAHLQGLDANLQHYQGAAVSRKARSRRSGPVVMLLSDGTLPC